MLTSPVKDIRGYCFYSGLFDPLFPCPCRAKLAGQRSLWWSDMAFLPVRSLGPVYLYACLKETRSYTQTLHTVRKMSLSCLIKHKLSSGEKKRLFYWPVQNLVNHKTLRRVTLIYLCNVNLPYYLHHFLSHVLVKKQFEPSYHVRQMLISSFWHILSCLCLVLVYANSKTINFKIKTLNYWITDRLLLITLYYENDCILLFLDAFLYHVHYQIHLNWSVT